MLDFVFEGQVGVSQKKKGEKAILKVNRINSGTILDIGD